MKFVFFWMIFFIAAGQARADIFEHARASDTALRDVVREDRASYYYQSPGLAGSNDEEAVSDVKMLAVDRLARPLGLRDMDKAFDAYLLEQLSKDREYRGLVASSHPLLLLEYASPVLADVVKHYRMSTYERLAIEQARLGEIDRSTEGRSDRLSRQSERECLIKNEGKGLVAAMRLCQKAKQPFDALLSVDGSQSLEDGRRRIHVVSQALERLGFEKSRIQKIVDIAGDRVLSDDGYEDHFPTATFTQKVDAERQALGRAWNDALEKFHGSGKVSAVKLEDLSMAGIPVTLRTLADLDLLDSQEQKAIILKAAFSKALVDTEQTYRDVAGYLDLCVSDPVLPVEFRNILLEKRDFLWQTIQQEKYAAQGPEEYKGLLSSLAGSADVARERLRSGQGEAPLTNARSLMLNF